MITFDTTTPKTSEREVVAAAMRWHTAHAFRISIGAEQRRYVAAQKKRTGMGSSSVEISRRLTLAKRNELAASRALALMCSSARNSQRHVDVAVVIDAVLIDPPRDKQGQAA